MGLRTHPCRRRKSKGIQCISRAIRYDCSMVSDIMPEKATQATDYLYPSGPWAYTDKFETTGCRALVICATSVLLLTRLAAVLPRQAVLG